MTQRSVTVELTQTIICQSRPRVISLAIIVTGLLGGGGPLLTTVITEYKQKDGTVHLADEEVKI